MILFLERQNQVLIPIQLRVFSSRMNPSQHLLLKVSLFDVKSILFFLDFTEYFTDEKHYFLSWYTQYLQK